MKKQINKKLVIKGLNKKALSNLYGGKYLISNYMFEGSLFLIVGMIVTTMAYGMLERKV